MQRLTGADHSLIESIDLHLKVIVAVNIYGSSSLQVAIGRFPRSSFCFIAAPAYSKKNAYYFYHFSVSCLMTGFCL